MSPRKIGAIYVRPNENDKCGHYCMSLKTGCLPNHKNSTPLPMPSEVIDHVHIIANRAPVRLTFVDINNVAFLDISDDDEVVDVSDSESKDSDNYYDPSKAADPEDSVEITGVDDK